MVRNSMLPALFLSIWACSLGVFLTESTFKEYL